jgi:hypothetical protein
MSTSATAWPALPLEAWEDSKKTLHLYLQIVGKIQLALMPPKNHWWNITLLVSAKGITSHQIPYEKGYFEILFNLKKHRLEVTTSEGGQGFFPLHDGLSVSGFYRQLTALLLGFGIEFKIKDTPYDNESTIPFAEDKEHYHYDPEYVHRFWQILVQVDKAMQEFSGRFLGKTCPVHIYWHHLDLTVTRFCGKSVGLWPGASKVEAESYNQEVISFGFWPGDKDVRGAAFYSYTYPAPKGIDEEELTPGAAKWVQQNGSPMAILMYDDLRALPNPTETLMEFMESAYQAGIAHAKWPAKDLCYSPA